MLRAVVYGAYLLLLLWSGIVVAGETEWQAHMRAAKAAQKRGDARAAANAFDAALREAEAFGPQDRRLGRTLYRVALHHQAQGRLSEAESHLRRALAAHEAADGPGHPDGASVLNALGAVHQKQGRYPDMQAAVERALVIWEKANGPEHPSVATGLNNLGQAYALQGRYAEAEPLYLRALSIREKMFGGEHLSLVTVLNNLGGLYFRMGDLPKADAFAQRVLALRERIYGPNHIEVAKSLYDLARARRALGRLDEATALLQRSLEIVQSRTPAAGELSAATVRRALDDVRGAQDKREAAAAPVLQPLAAHSLRLADPVLPRSGKVTQIAAGAGQTCALLEGGAVYCWGAGLMGSDGRIQVSPSPQRIDDLPPARSISVHAHASCAVDSQSRVWCWGIDLQDSIRKNAQSVSTKPFLVEGLPPARDVSVGWTHACIVGQDGSIYCWGRNPLGELGSGTTTDTWRPVQVKELSGVTSLSTGVSNTCVVVRGSPVKCWGTDFFGPGGQGITFNSATPINIPNTDRIVKIANGRNFVCGVHDSGEVTCWGSNLFGQLGVSSAVTRDKVGGIARLDAVSGARTVATSMFAACAVVDGGRVRCWGLWEPVKVPEKQGTGERRVPVGQPPSWIEGIEDAQHVAVGEHFACALRSSGKVTCWGDNTYGQLGTGKVGSTD